MKEHSEHLPQCPDARISTSIQSQPIIDIHRSHTAVSDAKYCISGDMANVMIDGASELEMGETMTYPLGSEAQDCKKDVSNGDQYLELQCIWSSTKCNAKLK